MAYDAIELVDFTEAMDEAYARLPDKERAEFDERADFSFDEKETTTSYQALLKGIRFGAEAQNGCSDHELLVNESCPDGVVRFYVSNKGTLREELGVEDDEDSDDD